MIITKQKYTIIILSIFFILLLGTGIYFVFVQKKNNTSISNVDKYSDITTWCDASTFEEILEINCAGLLLDIVSVDTENSCFEAVVITNGNELKNISICEKSGNLSYTNDVLNFKKLMPINMIFTYNKQGLSRNYTFSRVSITHLDNTYVQNTVNEDIANLVTIDPSSTTIENSVDFCPKPEILPEYITEENRSKYTQFYNTNKMDIADYENATLYKIEDSAIRTLLTCESKVIRSDISNCVDSTIPHAGEFIQAIELLPKTPVWENVISESDQILIKEISLLYDATDLVQFENYSPKILSTVISNMDLTQEEIFCGTYKISEKIVNNTQVIDYKTYVKEVLESNAQKIRSFICQSIIKDSEVIDNEGLYISIKLKNLEEDNFQIINRCFNLYATIY